MLTVHRKRSSDERGIVTMWMALVVVLLVGCAAFAVDVTAWHLEHNREQRAADAAALAGSVSFPGNPATANSAARDVAATNDYQVSQVTPFDAGGKCALAATDTTRICAGPGAQAYQYKVKVARRVENIFGGIFGLGSTVVTATATAVYFRPLSMGSPSNQFGNDPDSVTQWPVTSPISSYPNLWANVAGGNSIKQNGDAYTANYCNTTTDGCSGSGARMNQDYEPQGYFYTVDFTQSATVDLQAFDPAFVEVGDFCTDGAANLAGASSLGNVPSYPQGSSNTTDIARRYRPVTNQSDQTDRGYQYCTGDQIFTNNGTTGPAPATTYTVLKATVPGDPSSAQPACAPITYPGFNGNLATALGSGVTPVGAPAPLAKYFRQWATLCTVTGQLGDEYFIQVSTDAASQGHNRFALRGTTVNGGGSAPVHIAGNGTMGIYANVGTRPTQFNLVQVPSAAAGHTLLLNFFDIGDAPSGSLGTLTIVPPADSNVGSSFSGCQWTGASGTGAVGYATNTPTGPWGPFTPITGCAMSGVNDSPANWNGQWTTVSIPVPANYTCDDDDPNGCWTKINYQFTGGINDTTSWNVVLLGDPVRLTS